ncbi:MAG: TonB-dependent receptor plug domain-containing protein [Cyclobacteriaceae bacterium]|nr:TonB-dependent receptor plug domain-containing protein [Cyclobacteriaceae bacterium]
MRNLLTLLICCCFATVTAQEIKPDTAQQSHISLNTDNKPLFVVNGERTDYTDLSSIKPNDIESIQVIKNQHAIDQFGEAGKNGVVLITLKNFKKFKLSEDPESKPSAITLPAPSTGSQPLFVFDGKIIQQADAEKINPQNIESIDVLKGEVATNLYGEKGNNGVVVITSKKPPMKIRQSGKQ